MWPALNLPLIIFEFETTGFAHRYAEHISRLLSSPIAMQSTFQDYCLRPSLRRAHFKTHSDQSVMRGLKCCNISYLGTSSMKSFSSYSGLGLGYLFIFIVFISKNVEREITDCLDVNAPDANSLYIQNEFWSENGYVGDLSTDRIPQTSRTICHIAQLYR